MKRKSMLIASAVAAVLAAGTLGFGSAASAQGWGMMGGYGPGYTYGHMGYGRGDGPGFMHGYGPGYRSGRYTRGYSRGYGRGYGPGYGWMGGYGCWGW